MASVIARDPPAATGQPAACPSNPRPSAKADVPAALSGSIEWAPHPARSARAASPRKRPRPRRSTGRTASRAKTAGQQRMPGQPGWAEDVGKQRLPAGYEWSHQPPVGGTVRPQPLGCQVQRAVQHCRPPTVQGMRQREIGVEQPQAVRGEWERAQERRGDRQRVNARAHVVQVAGQCQLLGAGAAPRSSPPLQNPHRSPRQGKRDRRGKAVRPGADDDCIRHPQPVSEWSSGPARPASAGPAPAAASGSPTARPSACAETRFARRAGRARRSRPPPVSDRGSPSSSASSPKNSPGASILPTSVTRALPSRMT